jgi:protein-tyrosine phosphatase
MGIKGIAKNIYWSTYGKTICNPALPESIKSVLFICLGNICRSPFAEKFAATNYKGPCAYDFSSAGILGEFPRPSPVEAIEAAECYGVDLNGHLSRRLDTKMIEYFDVIFVMDVWQYNYMNHSHHGIRNKLFLLPLYENNPIGFKDKYFIYNIKDPYGKTITDFSECYKRIVNCMSEFMKAFKS